MQQKDDTESMERAREMWQEKREIKEGLGSNRKEKRRKGRKKVESKRQGRKWQQ